MPSYANLLHPIECPYCKRTSGHEISFLEGLLAEDCELDLRLGEGIEGLPATFCGKIRTRGLSLCNFCQKTVTALITLVGGRIRRIEVFPRPTQDLLVTFPHCLYLQNSDDGDLQMLSDLQAQYGAQNLGAAIRALSKKRYTVNYWAQLKQRYPDLVSKHPGLLRLLQVLHDEDPGSVDESTRSQLLQAGLEDLAADPQGLAVLRGPESSAQEERQIKHRALQEWLAQNYSTTA